jgi:hypothetical protein
MAGGDLPDRVADWNRNQQHWVRLGTGELTQVSLPAVKYYQLPEPVGWEYARHPAIPDSFV